MSNKLHFREKLITNVFSTTRGVGNGGGQGGGGNDGGEGGGGK